MPVPRIFAPQNPSPAALAISCANGFNLLFVLVADIDITPLGAADEPRNDDSLDQQVRGKDEQIAIFECARLAFVAIAHHVFHLARRAANGGPLAERGEGGAPHAAEVSFLQDLQDGIAEPDPLPAGIGVVIGLPGLGPTANHFVAGPVAVGIDLPTRGGLVGHLPGERLPRQGSLHQVFQFGSRLVPIHPLVDADGRRAVAPAQAGNTLDGDLARGLLARFLKMPAEALAAGQMTCHVAAHFDCDSRGRLQLVMRKETGDLVQAMQGLLDTRGKGPKLVLRQASVFALNMVEFLNDHARILWGRFAFRFCDTWIIMGCLPSTSRSCQLQILPRSACGRDLPPLPHCPPRAPAPLW